jgi:hypothetical protein
MSNKNTEFSLNDSADMEKNINDSNLSVRDSSQLDSNVERSTSTMTRDYIENDPNYLGDSSNPNLISGPLNVRNYTNKFCLLIFLIVYAVWIFISIQGFSQGNPSWLSTPFDSTGNKKKKKKKKEK